MGSEPRSPGGYDPVKMGLSIEQRGGKSDDLVQGLSLFPHILPFGLVSTAEQTAPASTLNPWSGITRSRG
jgi:hypothetical protein